LWKVESTVSEAYNEMKKILIATISDLFLPIEWKK
jgi:hypothetical protein